jgi:hypothetical protein
VEKTMKAAFLPGNSTGALKDAPVPEPGHGEFLIRMKSSTICGSDIRAIYRELLGKGPEGYQNKIAGHGDELVIADGNFPAATIAQRLVRSDGNMVSQLLEAILEFFPLDKYVPKPVERFAFYERAKNAYAIIATRETALYANMILKKDVVI